jgi:hypothetical protein
MINATKAGGVYNPTSDVVEMAFKTGGQPPGNSDWQTAEWDTVNGQYVAKCLVGPGGTIQLTVGSYTVYVKITDNPEIPVLIATTPLEITPF